MNVISTIYDTSTANLTSIIQSMELLKHMTLNADLTGGELMITMKDEQENSMTQIANLIPSLVLGSIFQ